MASGRPRATVRSPPGTGCPRMPVRAGRELSLEAYPTKSPPTVPGTPPPGRSNSALAASDTRNAEAAKPFLLAALGRLIAGIAGSWCFRGCFRGCCSADRCGFRRVARETYCCRGTTSLTTGCAFQRAAHSLRAIAHRCPRGAGHRGCGTRPARASMRIVSGPGTARASLASLRKTPSIENGIGAP